MSIEKIKLNKDELIHKLKLIFSELAIDCDEFDCDKNPIQIKIKRNDKKSVLRIYCKRDGLKLDTSVGADKELNIEVESKFNDFETTTQKTYSFKKVSENDYENIKDKINKLDKVEIIQKENKDPNKKEFLEIQSIVTHERILVSSFKNGTLMLQGIVWNLWEDICEIIDTSINSSIEDIINRFSFGESDKNNSEDYSKEENDVKQIITSEVFDFLDEHYRDYLISAQCILNSSLKMKEFSTVLCPTAKVLEGFLKKVLIELGIEKLINMEDGWSFGKVLYNSDINRHIIYKYAETSRLSADKEFKIFELYDAVRFYRNDLNHGSPKPKIIVKEKSNALEIYNEILIKIKDGYYNIIK
ncbi:type II toxin-antitoxin system RnlA family toxin [uncultured Clostridium sp.]|uniref:type II toxin-antitoxin system RnlA family toxin n=1 Tax=uncultured Clostridium sp. TaxID=59620 RepID=UPI0026012991|nr:type II toxin-antitoxin system RnlA family toxin [uncultured Clostridium sp.]